MTDRPLTEAPNQLDDGGGPGERMRRLQRRRRMIREEMLAVAVLLLFLAATVAVLATQWLGSGTSVSSGRPVPASATIPNGGAT